MIDQPLGVQSTLSIIDDATGKNLLTIGFTGQLIGLSGSPNANINSSGIDIISLTSDFGVVTTSDNSMNLGLATLSPACRSAPEVFSIASSPISTASLGQLHRQHSGAVDGGAGRLSRDWRDCVLRAGKRVRVACNRRGEFLGGGGTPPPQQLPARFSALGQLVDNRAEFLAGFDEAGHGFLADERT